VCNLRVATFGNKDLRVILDAVYWRYKALYEEKYRLDPEWARAARSYHTLRLLGVLYSGEEMGNSLSSPLIQSEKWNQEAPQTSLQFSHRKLYDQSSCTREHASSPVNTNRLKSALKKAGDKLVTAVVEKVPGSIQRSAIDTFVGERWARAANCWRLA